MGPWAAGACPGGQIFQDEELEEMSPAQTKDRDHVFLILKVKEMVPTIHMHSKFPWRSKGECCHPTHKPLLEPILAKRHMCMQGRTMRVTNRDSGPGKARWLVKGNQEEIPHMSDSNYHEGVTLSLSPPMCLSPSTLFPPNKHLTCFTTLCGKVFLQSLWARALSLASALVV